MISEEHKKHTEIARPSYGFFHRNEWSFVGAPCDIIQSLAGNIIQSLSGLYKGAYVDAKHAGENENTVAQEPQNVAVAAYTDFIHHRQFNFKKEFDDFSFRQMFNDVDMVLINGNHFKAKSQVVIIDERKKESLKKRLSQLTNIELILLSENITEPFDFIKDFGAHTKTPVYKLSDTSLVIEFFKSKMAKAKPSLNGLVLAGGKSKRLGYDKATIEWHGQQQQYYLADMLKTFCGKVFISCRHDQRDNIATNYTVITDTFTGLGPYGAILSAFREEPDAAWLVVACDLPLLDLETLQYLSNYRNASAMTTSFESPFNHFPEPLVTIWEPKSYPVLLSFLSQGITCPGKALRNMDTYILPLKNVDKLINVNTKEDVEKVQQQTNKKALLNNAG